MSLRLLEQLTRSWRSDWSLVDLGTGSGIFALAARRLGAGVVTAIDTDRVAISTATENARLNRIGAVRFKVADARKWPVPLGTGIVTANLFSELLIEVVPKLQRVPWLVLSGIMRDQEPEVVRALNRSGFRVLKTRRRRKWIAILARSRRSSGGFQQPANAGRLVRRGR